MLASLSGMRCGVAGAQVIAFGPHTPSAAVTNYSVVDSSKTLDAVKALMAGSPLSRRSPMRFCSRLEN
jgi:hypothetical protein